MMTRLTLPAVYGGRQGEIYNVRAVRILNSYNNREIITIAQYGDDMLTRDEDQIWCKERGDTAECCKLIFANCDDEVGGGVCEGKYLQEIEDHHQLNALQTKLFKDYR